MSPLQLVSSGLKPANERSEDVGDAGGLELVLPNRMTRPGTAWASEDKASLKQAPSAGWWSKVGVVFEADVVALVVAPEACWTDCGAAFFKAAVVLLFCSW